MKFTQHTCIGETRWDTIAHKAYGEFSNMKPILDANPQLEIHSLLPSGTIVNVPIIEVTVADVIGLPPWKQQVSTEGIETAKAAASILEALTLTGQSTFGESFDGSFD
jgi:Phage Tail Protein X